MTKPALHWFGMKNIPFVGFLILWYITPTFVKSHQIDRHQAYIRFLGERLDLTPIRPSASVLDCNSDVWWYVNMPLDLTATRRWIIFPFPLFLCQILALTCSPFCFNSRFLPAVFMRESSNRELGRNNRTQNTEGIVVE